MLIDIAKDFSSKPFGRDSRDGKFSGSRFRDDILIKSFRETHRDEVVEVHLDGVLRGYGSSFLDEAFAGLIRCGIDYSDIKRKLKIISDDDGYIEEIWTYIEEEHSRSR